jgi:hypothetical protein
LTPSLQIAYAHRHEDKIFDPLRFNRICRRLLCARSIAHTDWIASEASRVQESANDSSTSRVAASGSPTKKGDDYHGSNSSTS